MKFWVEGQANLGIMQGGSDAWAYEMLNLGLFSQHSSVAGIIMPVKDGISVLGHTNGVFEVCD